MDEIKRGRGKGHYGKFEAKKGGRALFIPTRDFGRNGFEGGGRNRNRRKQR